MARVGGHGIDRRPPRYRQLVERVRRLAVGVEHRQSLAAQPEPAAAVANQVRHWPVAGIERWRGDPAPVDREGPQPAVGRQQQLALGPRDRVADLVGLAGFGQRDDFQPQALEAGAIRQTQQQLVDAVMKDPGRAGVVEGAQPPSDTAPAPRERPRRGMWITVRSLRRPSASRRKSPSSAFQVCPSGVKKQASGTRPPETWRPRTSALPLRQRAVVRDAWSPAGRVDRDDRAVTTDQKNGLMPFIQLGLHLRFNTIGIGRLVRRRERDRAPRPVCESAGMALIGPVDHQDTPEVLSIRSTDSAPSWPGRAWPVCLPSASRINPSTRVAKRRPIGLPGCSMGRTERTEG